MNHPVKPPGLATAAGVAAVLLLLALFQGAHALAAGDPPPPAPVEEKAPLPPIDIAGRGYWVLVANQSFTETTQHARASSLAVINTASNAVYGPFLEGRLGMAFSCFLDNLQSAGTLSAGPAVLAGPQSKCAVACRGRHPSTPSCGWTPGQKNAARAEHIPILRRPYNPSAHHYSLARILAIMTG